MGSYEIIDLTPTTTTWEYVTSSTLGYSNNKYNIVRLTNLGRLKVRWWIALWHALLVVHMIFIMKTNKPFPWKWIVFYKINDCRMSHGCCSSPCVAGRGRAPLRSWWAWLLYLMRTALCRLAPAWPGSQPLHRTWSTLSQEQLDEQFKRGLLSQPTPRPSWNSLC